jgi:hypothetical protein
MKSKPKTTSQPAAGLPLLVAGVLLQHGALAQEPDRVSAEDAQPADIVQQFSVVAPATEYDETGGVDVALGGTREPTIVVNPTDPNNIAMADLFCLRVSADGGSTFLAATPAQIFAGSDNDGDGNDGEDPVEAGVDNDLDGNIDEDPVDGVDNDLDGNIDEDPAVNIDNDGDGLLNEDPTYQARSGDPSLTFDSAGRLFWTWLVSERTRFDTDGNGTLDSNARVGIDLAVAQVNPSTGAIQAGYPVNITTSPGVGLPAVNGITHDKQWVAADRIAGNTFQDRLYLVWTDFSTNPVSLRAAFSSDQGMTWTLATTNPLTAAGEGFAWPSHIAVASNGDVYIAYHSQPTFNASNAPNGTSGQILVLRSTDGGVTYPTKTTAFTGGNADITFNVQTNGRTLNGSVSWTQGSAQPWILPDPADPNNLSIVAADDPTNTNHGAGFDDMDIFIARSTDQGATWSAPSQIDSGPAGTTQFFPTAAIDDTTGCISVMYYDTRGGATNAAGNFLLDVYLATSTDGGTTFGADVQVNDQPFDPDPGAPTRFAGPPPTLRIGEYNGIALSFGRADMVWCSNTFDLLGNAIGQQISYDCAIVCNLPPVADAGPDQTVECTSPAGAMVTLDGTASFDPNGGSDQANLLYTWTGPFGTVSNDPMPTVTIPLGGHLVTLEVEDPAGETDTDTVLITVNDTAAPVITLSVLNPLTLECNVDTFDALGVADVSDICDANPSLMVLINDVDLTQPGNYSVLYEAEDSSGNTSQLLLLVDVVDTLPPVITNITATPASLWPPNHKFAEVAITVDVTDLCDPAPVCTITSITSNEPDNGLGDGNTAPDYMITGPLTAQLRAERSGRRDGRLYTLSIECADASGNTATDTVTVAVEHDRRR